MILIFISYNISLFIYFIYQNEYIYYKIGEGRSGIYRDACSLGEMQIIGLAVYAAKSPESCAFYPFLAIFLNRAHFLCGKEFRNLLLFKIDPASPKGGGLSALRLITKISGCTFGRFWKVLCPAK
jgi:hypothetical protein